MTRGVGYDRVSIPHHSRAVGCGHRAGIGGGVGDALGDGGGVMTKSKKHIATEQEMAKDAAFTQGEIAHRITGVYYNPHKDAELREAWDDGWLFAKNKMSRNLTSGRGVMRDVTFVARVVVTSTVASVIGAAAGYGIGVALDRWVLCDMACMLAERGLRF